MATHLTLERRTQEDHTVQAGPMLMTPPDIGSDYWEYRVQLTETQAVLGFPKFNTIGIGFAVEEDWNTNMPFFMPANTIAEHIAHNKGDAAIDPDDVVTAIELVQDAVYTDHPEMRDQGL